MTSDRTNAERQKRWRAKRAAEIEALRKAAGSGADTPLQQARTEIAQLREQLRSHKPKPGALTLEDLRERMAALIHDMPKEQRMREISQMMKAVDLNIHDWVSTKTIGKRRS